MADDPIAREIKQIRQDVREGFAGIRADTKEDFAEVKQQLAGLLPRELYEAHRDSILRRLDAAEADVKQLRAEIDRVDEKRTTAMRWRIGSVIFPAISIIVGIILFVLRP